MARPERFVGDASRQHPYGRRRVATIGGPDFGVHGEGYLRLSYANSRENIVRALRRIEDFLGSERPPA